MTEHTRGPWNCEAGNANVVYAEDGTMIVDASDMGSGVEDEDEREANARLIAAAPVMLEALRVALSSMKGWDCPPADIETVEAALAAAEGVKANVAS